MQTAYHLCLMNLQHNNNYVYCQMLDLNYCKFYLIKAVNSMQIGLINSDSYHMVTSSTTLKKKTIGNNASHDSDKYRKQDTILCYLWILPPIPRFNKHQEKKRSVLLCVKVLIERIYQVYRCDTLYRIFLDGDKNACYVFNRGTLSFLWQTSGMSTA